MMPEQADAAHAADSKEAHTDIHQAPSVSHTGEEATEDDSSVVQCGEGPCDAGGSAASARFDAGEVMQSTAANLHPCTSRNKQETPEFFFTPYAGRFGWFLVDLKPNMAISPPP